VDPSHVSVWTEARDGAPQLILGDGAEEVSRPLPKSSPPFLGANRPDISVARDSSGNISVICPTCLLAERALYVERGKPIALSNVQPGEIAWDRNASGECHQLHWLVDVSRAVPSVSGGRFSVSTEYVLVPLARLVFTTPAANVRSATASRSSLIRCDAVSQGAAPKPAS
jgi:hypothetical protein